MVDEITGLRLPSCRFYVFVKDGQCSVRDARKEFEPVPCESFRDAQIEADRLNFQAVA